MLCNYVVVGHIELVNMKEWEGMLGLSSEKKSKIVPPALIVLSLCALCFYLGGIFCSNNDELLVQSVPQGTDLKVADCQPQAKVTAFKECNITFQDLTPCMDPGVRHSVKFFFSLFCFTVLILLCGLNAIFV